ncbi:MAG TPA: replicative DNA helicase, partial [Anaerolineae bacterium]|nr:replicative DNA helicase [Anaerolineae bacterium]
GKIAALAYQEADDVEEVVDRAEEILFGVSERRVSRELVPIRQVLSEYYDRIEYLTSHRGELIGIPTGFERIDKLLGGLQRSDMVILAARPSVGKTSLALSFAHNAAKKYNQRVAFFSLEMSSEQVVQRLIAAETGINSQRLRRGEIEEHEWNRFIKATNDLAETHFYIDDTPGVSAMELRTKARRLHAEVGLDLIIVDYLQLMRGDHRSENRVQEISAISRSLKALARELNVPLLALSQLSRGVESRTDKRPILSDLRESGALEQDADVVMFIYRDEMYNENTEWPNIADIIIAKHRNGPTGTVQLYFKKELAQFLEAEVRRTEVDIY